MSTVSLLTPNYQFNRQRTLSLLDTIEERPDAQAVLGWRPGPGRAHIGWQLMHIFLTEEIFATERLKPEKARMFEDLWPRFRGGSTPDDTIPTAAELRKVANPTRDSLLETLAEFGDERLHEIPPALAQRGFTILTVLHILNWHEGHHQGQAHLTFNLYKANHA